MTDKEQLDLDRLIGGLEPPAPPAGLRARALRAAGERLAEPPAPDIWSRIWNNRGLRLAWAAAVVVLVAAHLVVGSAPGSVVAPVRSVEADRRPDDSFLEILRPVEIDAEAHPTIGRFAAAEDSDQIEIGGNPS